MRKLGFALFARGRFHLLGTMNISDYIEFHHINLKSHLSLD